MDKVRKMDKKVWTASVSFEEPCFSNDNLSFKKRARKFFTPEWGLLRPGDIIGGGRSHGQTV